jgi:NADH-ubiquinone oxidoreductase chain 5
MGFKYAFEHSHESGNFMNTPLILLSIGGFVIGFLSKDLFIGLGTSF